MKTAPSCNFSEESVTISVGPDGRLYFHDLSPDLIRVALALNPEDAGMRRRLALSEGDAETRHEEAP